MNKRHLEKNCYCVHTWVAFQLLTGLVFLQTVVIMKTIELIITNYYPIISSLLLIKKEKEAANFKPEFP